MTVRSGRSKFTLTTLPAQDFPKAEAVGGAALVLPQGKLRRMIGRASFAMAQNDVRYYLNGMLFELEKGRFNLVATDGHRLAAVEFLFEAEEDKQVVVPRKGVLELVKLLTEADQDVELRFAENRAEFKTNSACMNCKLIDGKFPDYQRLLMPLRKPLTLKVGRELLKAALQRASILSHDKYKGVALVLACGKLVVKTANAAQEQAEEDLELSYNGVPLEIGFNAQYLLDVLGVMRDEEVLMVFAVGSNHKVTLVTLKSAEADGLADYQLMPMRL